MSLLPAVLLDPLRRFRSTEDAHFLKCEPDEMPALFRNLLVHSGDMTTKLEKHHSSRISLEVLQCGHGERGHYYREVILRSANNGEAVEYGAIEIFLETLPPQVQTEITAGRIPLGGLLNSHGIRYQSRPQAFFRVHKEPALCELLRVPFDSELYGRCNILCTDDGELMARILEVLPPVTESKTGSL